MAIPVAVAAMVSLSLTVPVPAPCNAIWFTIAARITTSVVALFHTSILMVAATPFSSMKPSISFQSTSRRRPAVAIMMLTSATDISDLVQFNTPTMIGAWSVVCWNYIVGPDWRRMCFRFNISENDDLACGDRTCGGIGFGPAAGTAYVYNNTVYDNVNGTQSNGVNTTFIRLSGIALSCMSSGIIANNIFALTEDHNGTNSFVYLQNGGTTWCPGGPSFKANDYYAITGGTTHYQWVSAPSTSVLCRLSRR